MKTASLELSAASYPRRVPLTTGCCFWCTSNRVLRKWSKKCPPYSTWYRVRGSLQFKQHGCTYCYWFWTETVYDDRWISFIYLFIIVYLLDKDADLFFVGENEVKFDFDVLCYSFRPTFPSRKGHSLIGCHSNQWWLSKVVNQTIDKIWFLSGFQPPLMSTTYFLKGSYLYRLTRKLKSGRQIKTFV